MADAADSPASMRVWVAEANRLRAELPPEVEATPRRHEDAGTTDTPEYVEAVQVAAAAWGRSAARHVSHNTA